MSPDQIIYVTIATTFAALFFVALAAIVWQAWEDDL